MKRLILACLALVFATAAPATTLVRMNGEFLVGQPCTMADGTRFLCPSVTLSDSSGTELGTVGNPLRTQGAGGTTVQPIGAATGGLTVSSKIVANNTTSVAVDAAPGTLYGVTVFNNSATIAYLKIYDAAQGSTTCGSGTPSQRIMIPANTSGAGAVIPFPLGIAYATAITSCVTTGIADNDTGAPAASAYLTAFYYK